MLGVDHRTDETASRPGLTRCCRTDLTTSSALPTDTPLRPFLPLRPPEDLPADADTNPAPSTQSLPPPPRQPLRRQHPFTTATAAPADRPGPGARRLRPPLQPPPPGDRRVAGASSPPQPPRRTRRPPPPAYTALRPPPLPKVVPQLAALPRRPACHGADWLPCFSRPHLPRPMGGLSRARSVAERVGSNPVLGGSLLKC